ncbi:MAG: T9SS type A sorting domain-containing protein [Bacteroidetes bacterium]|nr:T9SS type A sorting domain-containing protein [Bacteroidota bacterium]
MKKNYKTLILSTSFIVGVQCINAQSIACGGWHSLGICNDSTVKAFGENATGQIGNGNTTDQSTPTTVTGLSGIKAVSAGGDQLEAHSMALKSNGTVWCWGSNLYGALGNASTTGTYVTSPVQALILTNAISISAGGWHSLALKSDGTVWCWGWNADGQVGDGTIIDKTIPTQVSGLTGIIKISAGSYHNLALKNDGTVWAWGDNVNGQIGDGTTGTDRTTPVQVSGLTNVVAVAAGRFFSLAVKNDGTVWAWGQNLYGQLGNGNNTDSNVPVQVSGLSGISSAVVATGAFHCHALKSDGTVWSWGRNTYGNLGDNTLNNSNVPVQMLSFNSPIGIAAGTNFSLFYKADGSLWGTGRNASGQLGDGTVNQHNVASQSTVMCSVLQQPSSVSIFKNNLQIVDFNVSPNPTTGNLFLNFKNNNLKDYTVTIYNSIGQQFNFNSIVIEKDNVLNLDLSNLSNGLYILNISGNGSKFSHKIIKQ